MLLRYNMQYALVSMYHKVQFDVNKLAVCYDQKSLACELGR